MQTVGVLTSPELTRSGRRSWKEKAAAEPPYSATDCGYEKRKQVLLNASSLDYGTSALQITHSRLGVEQGKISAED
jgi:hypothetical protein